ncbi:secreted RxLR effector protein 161-like [Henckelia pumila]|uniref:secreted RxLR effector protein 161-like n=1 Tax=Henckelia pumila TaxID=405737 RepID=UPI003C6E7069
MELEQLDVNTAFLHGNLDEEILMSQLDGFIKETQDGKVCLLKKSLYGLNKAPRQSYRCIDDFMIQQGFKRSMFDNCVYFNVLQDGLLSRFMSKPRRDHWQVVKWLFRYLKGTSQLKLVYSGIGNPICTVAGYCDSDYAADLDKRRSISGYVFIVGDNVVSWKSSLQHVVALSTSEAEYISLTEAVKEGMWIKGFMEEIGFS